MQKLQAITARPAAYERGAPAAPPPALQIVDARWRVLIGAVQDGKLSTPYRYTTDKPGESWMQTGFDDQAWKSGLAPFGHGPGTVRTAWSSGDIYLRKTFDYDGAALRHGGVVISFDEDTEVYINGQQILSVKGFIGNYRLHEVTAALRKALQKGANTIAVHTHQTWGGQFIDLALLVD